MSRTAKITVLILFIFISIPAYPMLILRQQKKKSPAYLLMHKKKIDNESTLPQDQKREGFEFVIVGGATVIKGVGAVVSSAGAAATLVAANYLTKWFTGKDLFRHQLDKDIRRAAKDYDQKAADKAQIKEEKRAARENMIALIHSGETEELSNSSVLNTLKSSKIEIDSVREVDYQNNPEDRAWLEQFAQKICPSGGYTIEVGDITLLDENVSSSVAFVMPPAPNDNHKKPNKRYDSHDLHEAAEKFYDAIGHKIGEHALDHAIEEWKQNDKDQPIKVEAVKQESSSRVEYDFSKCAPSIKLDLDGEKLPSSRVEYDFSKCAPSVKLDLNGEKLPSTETFSSAPKESLKEEKTYASKWYDDDFYSSSSTTNNNDDDFDISSYEDDMPGGFFYHGKN